MTTAQITARHANADPFALVSAIKSDSDVRALAPNAPKRQRAEVLRLIAAGDVFGAGLVLAMAMGSPLIDPAALSV